MRQVLHNWNVDPKEARKIQEALRGSLVQKPLPKHIRYVAGADVSFNKYEKDVYAGIIVLSYPDLAPVEYSCVKTEVDFPYIPGFLSFREIPALMQCWEKLVTKPDVVIVDGHGIAHPRRLGIAAHFGLVADVPTIGAAKKILYGRHDEPAPGQGSASEIVDPKTDETIGYTLRTKSKVKPMLVSPGHKAPLEGAADFVMSLVQKHRLPEPTRQAHLLVNRFRTGDLADTHGFFAKPETGRTLI